MVRDARKSALLTMRDGVGYYDAASCFQGPPAIFAAAITGLSARKKHGTADDIARNAALIAMWAMGHKMPKMSEG